MTITYLSGTALIHHVRLWTLGVEVLNFRLHCSAILCVRCARAYKRPASGWGVLLGGSWVAINGDMGVSAN